MHYNFTRSIYQLVLNRTINYDKEILGEHSEINFSVSSFHKDKPHEEIKY